MGLLKKFFTNCAHPKGRMGRAMLKFMNLTHAPLHPGACPNDCPSRLWSQHGMLLREFVVCSIICASLAA